jgi:hypothetical protein
VFGTCFQGDQIKVDEMGVHVACDRREEHKKFCQDNMKERDQ